MSKKTELRVKSLTEVIQKWTDDNCENTGLWIKHFWGDKSCELMARAAISVMEAIGEVQEYALKEGLLFEE